MKVHLQPQKDYWEKKGKLSDRVRPNCEAAPWVIEEIKKLEAMLKEPTKLMLIPEVMEQAGWRHCAVGQRTTQYCGMAEQARREEREACAMLVVRGCGDWVLGQKIAEAIRNRGNNDAD